MTGAFNVAVAEFGVLDQSGHVSTTPKSEQFSAWLNQGLENEISELKIPYDHRNPQQVGVIRGADAESRAQAAKRRAGQLNATVLVYGVISPTINGGYVVIPEYYIEDPDFNYGAEVSGSDRLGQPVPIDPYSNASLEANVALNARRQALQHIVLGLSAFLTGDYSEAEDEFRLAIDIRDWQEMGEGKEVAYLLLGAALLRSYDPCSAAPEKLMEAKNAFQYANYLNPHYQRSLLGLAAVSLEQAKIKGASDLGYQIDTGGLTQARDWYLKSLQPGDQPAQKTAQIPAKAAYGLGYVYTLGYENQVAGISGVEAMDYAQDKFEEVIKIYGDSGDPGLAFFAAHAHAGLGQLAGHREDYAAMSDEYLRAINMLRDIPNEKISAYIARFYASAAVAERELGNRDKARQYFQNAVDQAKPGVNCLAEIESWRQQLDALN
jgi:tetratricopeptide (TPR) repeat protein